MLTKRYFGVVLFIFMLYGCLKEQGDRMLIPSKTRLDFGVDKNKHTFSLINNRKQDKTFTLEPEVSWIIITPSSGTVAGWASLEINVIVNRLGVHPGIYDLTITLTSEEITKEIPVSVRVPTAFNRIVFSTRRNNDGTEDIYRMNMDGSGEAPLVTWPSDEIHPCISPDGKELLFTSDKEGVYNIYRMNMDGTGIEQLTFGDIFNQSFSPRWSPDGKRLVYSNTDGGINSQLFVMDKDGSNNVRITNAEYGRRAQPDWSPDGNTIVYLSTESSLEGDIYSIAPDGTAHTQITQSLFQEEQSPTFSPDGSKILFTRIIGFKKQLFQMDPTGENLQQLTTGGLSKQFPRMGEDYRIIFTAFNNSLDTLLFDSEVYTIDSAGQDLKQLTDYTNRWTHSFPDW